LAGDARCAAARREGGRQRVLPAPDHGLRPPDLRGGGVTDVVDRLLDGAVDLHVHPYPSPFPRRLDAAEAAQRAADAGMRAIVVKSHHHDTATDVAALKAHGIDASGIDVYGGVALNTQVGGLNPHAVNMSLAMGGK